MSAVAPTTMRLPSTQRSTIASASVNHALTLSRLATVLPSSKVRVASSVMSCPPYCNAAGFAATSLPLVSTTAGTLDGTGFVVSVEDMLSSPVCCHCGQRSTLPSDGQEWNGVGCQGAVLLRLTSGTLLLPGG